MQSHSIPFERFRQSVVGPISSPSQLRQYDLAALIQIRDDERAEAVAVLRTAAAADYHTY